MANPASSFALPAPKATRCWTAGSICPNAGLNRSGPRVVSRAGFPKTSPSKPDPNWRWNCFNRSWKRNGSGAAGSLRTSVVDGLAPAYAAGVFGAVVSGAAAAEENGKLSNCRCSDNPTARESASPSRPGRAWLRNNFPRRRPRPGQSSFHRGKTKKAL